jgi:prepilin-type processing-associated H-X9-DG protein
VGAALAFALQHLATLAVTPIALLLLVGIGYTLCAAIGYAVGRIPGSLGQFFTCVLIGPVFLVELLGFYLLTQAAFFTPAIVAAEQTGVGGTLQKLFLLVRRSLGRLIGYQALVWLVGVAVLGALLAGLTVVSSSGLVPMLAVQPLLKGLSPTALATLTSGPSVGPLLMLGLVLAALLCYPVIYLITAYVAVYLAVQPEEEAVLPLPAPRTAFAKGVGAGWVILSLALALWSGLTPAQGRGVGSATQARGERDDATWFRFECGDPATQARGERGEPAQEGGSAPPAISTSGEKGWPGLWAGLLEPFQVARSQSQRDQCLGNLKQIGVAVLMYTQDHNGNLPDQENWTEPLLPYLKDPSIFACPEAGSGVGYTFNQDLRGANLDALENPVDTVLAFDGAGGWGPVTTAILRHENPSHDKGANVLFADGHVKWCSRDNLQRWVSGPVEWRTPPGPLPPGTEGKMPYRLPPPGSGPGTPPGAAAGPGTPPGVGPGSKEAAPLGIPAFQKAQVPGPEVSNPQPSPDQGQASRLREEARQLKSRGDWGTALVKVDEALRLDPNNAEGYYIRAWIQLEHGAQAEASADFQKVLQLAPGTVWAREAEQALARLSAP